MATPAPALVTTTFFDQIGIKYEQAFGHDPGLLNFITRALSLIPAHASVLDVGCGTGKPVAATVSRSGRKVHGIDVSSTMVALSRQQVPDGTFEEISMFEFSPPAQYDAVFTIFCLFNMGGDLVGPLMKKINSWVVPGGYLFIGTMVADDFAEGDMLDEEDAYGGRHVPTRFMGNNASTLVYSRE
ncbi:hypothetical protein LSUE1_G007395, partial [Lachnellula suecica]